MVVRGLLPRPSLLIMMLAALTATLLLPSVPANAAGPRIDLRVLVVTDGQPEVEALRGVLADGGVPFDVVDLADTARPRIGDESLTVPDSVPHSRYQAVVLPSDAPEGLDSSELATLQVVEGQFGLRRLNASVRAVPANGLVEPSEVSGWSGPLDGGVAHLTAAAMTAGFGDMLGDVPLGDDVWAEIGVPLRGYTPLLTASSPDGSRTGPLAGVYTAGGREQLGLAFTYEPGSPAIGALAAGLTEWLTKGTHLGVRRAHLAVHVDDVLLPDARWVVGEHCAYGADCPPSVPPTPAIRMTAADVEHAVAWSQQHGFRLDLAFNGAGSAIAAPDGDDPLLDALVAHRSAFGFLNHTWSHEYLGCVRDYSVTPWRCATVPVLGWARFVPRSDIAAQIERNVAFARAVGFPIDASELVTGEHSGLRGDDEMTDDNPGLAGSLADEDVRTIAADASNEQDQRLIGAARTVPRHPIDLDYDTATFAETVDQYNWSHTSRADGGDGTCEPGGGCLPRVDPTDPAAAFTASIVPAEAAKALRHVLGNDSRPHYVHQPQLTEDRTLYPVLEKVLGDYRALYGAARPLLVPTMTESRDELARQAAWADAKRTTRAWLEDGAVITATDAPTAVPLTVPAGTDFGEPYGTGRSGWVTVTGEQRLTGPGT